MARCSNSGRACKQGQVNEFLIKYRTCRAWLLLLVWVVGCAAPKNETTPPVTPALPSPEQALPAAGAVGGWTQAEAPRTYDRDTLYDFMNGAADLYFTYGFVSLAVGDYQGPDGGSLRVEIYRTATDADAYGLFAYNAFGEPLDLGVQGRWKSKSGLSFWQGRTNVQITARDAVDDAALQAFGQAVSALLPAGGTPPEIVAELPLADLEPGSVRFFREQMALDNYLWLGPENVLGLGPDVEGAVATYELATGRATLLLVTFPDAARARAARQGLADAGVEDLVVASVADRALGAVFGQVGAEHGAALLERALAAMG